MDGLPADLASIPQYFGKAIDWLQQRPDVDPERLAILGSSRGGEAALLVGATFPAVKAVVANVPSHVVWQGSEPDRQNKTSSWMLGGRGLPFVSLVEPRVGTSWREWFEASLMHSSAPTSGGRDSGGAVSTDQSYSLPERRTPSGPAAKWPTSPLNVFDAIASRSKSNTRGTKGGGHAVLMPGQRDLRPRHSRVRRLVTVRSPAWRSTGLSCSGIGFTSNNGGLRLPRSAFGGSEFVPGCAAAALTFWRHCRAGRRLYWNPSRECVWFSVGLARK